MKVLSNEETIYSGKGSVDATFACNNNGEWEAVNRKKYSGVSCIQEQNDEKSNSNLHENYFSCKYFCCCNRSS